MSRLATIRYAVFVRRLPHGAARKEFFNRARERTRKQKPMQKISVRNYRSERQAGERKSVRIASEQNQIKGLK